MTAVSNQAGSFLYDQSTDQSTFMRGSLTLKPCLTLAIYSEGKENQAILGNFCSLSVAALTILGCYLKSFFLNLFDYFWPVANV